MGTWAVLNVPTGVDPTAIRRPRDTGSPMPELLHTTTATTTATTMGPSLVLETIPPLSLTPFPPPDSGSPTETS